MPELPENEAQRRLVDRECLNRTIEAVELGDDVTYITLPGDNERTRLVGRQFTETRRHGKNLTAQLERLLPVAQMLTERFTARNPSLRPLAAKRMARRYASAGNDCAKHGERTKAMSYLWRAFRSDPTYWRVYAYCFLALMPSQLGPALRRSFWNVRRVSHGATGRN